MKAEAFQDLNKSVRNVNINFKTVDGIVRLLMITPFSDQSAPLNETISVNSTDMTINMNNKGNEQAVEGSSLLRIMIIETTEKIVLSTMCTENSQF
ncbi:CLUMA_CG004557, isoform A [Clunio marinus]|uniref:CLUMA_CG004557, isoform A n=1 Tax=Clunio marinus TaxID=568069 RepID=A0A1J1HSB2_9DIPT|nr:CLUMA_CG004557, isoform A [Clunio marinus]